MSSLMIVESNPFPGSGPGFQHRFTGFQIDLLHAFNAPEWSRLYSCSAVL